MSNIMANVVFLAQCMDKNHMSDARTVREMLQIKGIADAFETHVSFEDEEYCIAAISFAEPREYERIKTEIQKDGNIKSIKILNPEQVPF